MLVINIYYLFRIEDISFVGYMNRKNRAMHEDH
jgi:hypothetical protein